MPTYEFKCDGCHKIYVEKMSFAQHGELKDKIVCMECGEKLTQVVAPLNFKLAGSGWHSDGSGFNSNGSGYDVTQREMDARGEDNKRLEDVMHNAPREDR